MAFNIARRKYRENPKIMRRIAGNLEDQLMLQRHREAAEKRRRDVELVGQRLMHHVAYLRSAPPTYDFLYSAYEKIVEEGKEIKNEEEGGGIKNEEEEGGIRIEEEEGGIKIEEEEGEIKIEVEEEGKENEEKEGEKKSEKERGGKKNEEEDGEEEEKKKSGDEERNSRGKRNRGRSKKRVYPWLNFHNEKK
uniref:Uncharacterized protein n=1 Tax=Strongyloides papillosus TaxID=174720 RepID=A0A0N5BQW8_STREA